MRSSSHFVLFITGCFVLSASCVRTAFADLSMGDSVISYNAVNAPTTFGGDPYNVGTASLGLPTPDTTFGMLTPFNPAFDLGHIVGIGGGGSLEIHMSKPVIVGGGRTLGIHAAVGIVDIAYPNGTTSSPASIFTDPRDATVSVSQDGSVWKLLSANAIDFTIPTNYYSLGVTTPGYQPTPGTEVADFAKPFTGTISDFDGRSWAQILTLLNGSAGGQWFDLSGTGLASVNYVKFEVASGQKMFVDSVVGIALPEPATLLFAPLLLALCYRKR